MENDLRDMVPPPKLMGRIGPISDVATYLRSGEAHLSQLTRLGGLAPQHDVLDIGCGWGRVAIQLTQVLAPTARYLGVEVERDKAEWCTEHITSRHPNFVFRDVDLHNQRYNPEGALQAAETTLPIEEGERFDLIFLFSVFTHMFPADVRRYLDQFARCLKPGGKVVATYFLINDDARAAIAAGEAKRSFLEQDGYYTDNLDMPEAAIAYDEVEARAMYDDAGFAETTVAYGGWRSKGGQDYIVATMPAEKDEARGRRRFGWRRSGGERR